LLNWYQYSGQVACTSIHSNESQCQMTGDSDRLLTIQHTSIFSLHEPLLEINLECYRQQIAPVIGTINGQWTGYSLYMYT
jgi:hypothetical protein